MSDVRFIPDTGHCWRRWPDKLVATHLELGLIALSTEVLSTLCSRGFFSTRNRSPDKVAITRSVANISFDVGFTPIAGIERRGQRS